MASGRVPKTSNIFLRLLIGMFKPQNRYLELTMDTLVTTGRVSRSIYLCYWAIISIEIRLTSKISSTGIGDGPPDFIASKNAAAQDF